MAPKDIMLDFPVTKIEVPGQPIPSPTRAHENTSPTPSYENDQQLDQIISIPSIDTNSDNDENNTSTSIDSTVPTDHVNVNVVSENEQENANESEEGEEEEEEKNHAIESIEEALEIQKRNFGETHPSIAKTLHSLSLEYKACGQYDKAIMNLREGLDILEERLGVIHASTKGMSIESGHTLPSHISSTRGSGSGSGSGSDNIDDDLSSKCSYDSRQTNGSMSMHSMLSGINMNMNMSSTNSITHANLSQAAIQAAKRQTLQIHEEKSLFYSCLANIYRDRKCYKEAMDHYLQALNMLVEADYPGDSPRVSMMMRIMKRTERALRRTS